MAVVIAAQQRLYPPGLPAPVKRAYTEGMDARLQFIPIMIVGFGTALCLTPLTRQIAIRLGVTAEPNKRNIHKRHVPLMGGGAIYLAFVLSLLLFSPPDHLRELGAIVAGTTLLALIGYLDDRRHLSPRLRLSVMTVAALLATLAGVQIRLFNNPLIDIPLTLFWIVALINAVNWIDNMDGLAAGTAAITAGLLPAAGADARADPSEHAGGGDIRQRRRLSDLQLQSLQHIYGRYGRLHLGLCAGDSGNQAGSSPPSL